jgi:glycosyltransferase involved in cell wall biosynthesis
MSNPLVSVLIDTFNHERFIEQAVESVLAQDFPPFDREILVVDDGSTDKTPELLSKFEPHLRILRKPNGGQASAFNHAIPQCRGQIVAFLDGDDWWAANKLSSVAAAFAANRAVGLVGHSRIEVLPGDVRRTELVRDAPRFRIDSVAGARLFRLRKSFLGTSRMAYRAEILKRIGQVPETLVFEADEFLFTLGALFSEVLLLREPLTFYRMQGQNLYQLHSANQAATRRKHAVIVALVDALRRRFAEEGVPEDVAHAVLESVQNEADVLRLSLGEGTPLDSFRTELTNYRVNHEHASLIRRILKYISVLPALVLPPRQYHSFKHKLAGSPLYARVRQKFLPFHQPEHVDRTGQWGL